MNKRILVTGGLGYIGSHTVVKLIENGYTPIIIDNLSNSNIDVLDDIKSITNVRPLFHMCDIRNLMELNSIVMNSNIESVIHFSALKSVSESINKPIEYYDNNVLGTINLLRVMKVNDIRNIIFSSSCTVYGEPDKYPVSETTETKLPKTPYGVTKYMCEKILEDTHEINSIALRYFNPIGNHESGLIYENPNNTPENLMPYIMGVIKGDYPHLKIFGNDYNTPDGTAIRDYIDVNDLADAHVKALDNVQNNNHDVINIGTGKGSSVIEIINAFKDEGVEIPYKFYPRRDGDIEKIWSDTKKSKKILGWETKNTLATSIKNLLTSILD